MIGLRDWFRARSRREQRLLLAMTALAVGTAIWALVLRPLDDALAGARERHAAAVARLGATRVAVKALRTGRPVRPLTGGLDGAIRAFAADAGFAIASLDPDGAGGLRVSIPSARAAAMTAWLARLERAGIVVDGATLTDNGDRTVAVRLVLRARGA